MGLSRNQSRQRTKRWTTLKERNGVLGKALFEQGLTMAANDDDNVDLLTELRNLCFLSTQIHNFSSFSPSWTVEG